MGLLDFLKSKKSNNHPKKIDFTDLLNYTTNYADESEMVDFTKKWSKMTYFAERWSEIYMEKYAINNMPEPWSPFPRSESEKIKYNSVDTKNEILIFCSWAAWDYCLNHDLISKFKDDAMEYIVAVSEKVSKTHNIDAIEFFNLYRNRFAIYKTDIRGLLKSHYPQTPQYMPVSLYTAFYKKQYKIFTNPESSFIDEGEDFEKFMNGFIPFWNELNRELMNNFKESYVN